MKKFSTILLVLLIALALALATFACDDKPKQGPHESTITAFGKTAKVTGDASISTADFNKAVENLGDTLSAMDNSSLPVGMRTGLTKMVERGITIVAGVAVPASVGGALTVGVEYLKSSTVKTIGDALANLVNAGAFAV